MLNYFPEETAREGRHNKEGNPVSLRPILHVPFDADLYHEFNVEHYAAYLKRRRTKAENVKRVATS